MSAFVGVVLLDGRTNALPQDLLLPDEPGLDPPRRLTSPASAIVHRQRVVTPQDRGERQPWSAWNGGGWVAFAGRLDDRRALAAALDVPRPDETADGALAALAFERWGRDGLTRLIGDYALAAWHDGRRELTLAGDPMGMRTLYYWWQPGRAVFSTTLPGMLAVPVVPRALNEPFLADFIVMTLGDEESTFYHHIRKVRAGTAVTLTASGAWTHEFHAFDAGRRLRFADDDSCLDAARETLERAVSDRRRAVAPVPIAASGGLDSACMVVGARADGAPSLLLTAVPEPGLPVRPSRASYVSERSRVEALAAAFPGVAVEFVAPPPDADWSPDAQAVIRAGALPQRTPSQIPWAESIHRRAAAIGARSLMVGALGNHTVSWNGRQAVRDLFRRGHWLTMARELAFGLRHGPAPAARLLRDVVHSFLPRDFSAAALTARAAIRPDALQALGVLDRVQARGDDARFTFADDHRQWLIHVLRRGRCYRSDWTNLLRARHGLDETMPLGDVRMVEFCLAISEDQFVRNGRSRRLARRLLRAAGVPAVIADSEVRGQQHPEWFAHLDRVRPAMPAQLAALRQSPTAARIIDLDRLDRLVADWPADTAAAHRRDRLFHFVLPRALHVGAFIAWAEARANATQAHRREP
jgi:asparagine synthase (glutamine-hydrolysing)